MTLTLLDAKLRSMSTIHFLFLCVRLRNWIAHHTSEPCVSSLFLRAIRYIHIYLIFAISCRSSIEHPLQVIIPSIDQPHTPIGTVIVSKPLLNRSYRSTDLVQTQKWQNWSRQCTTRSRQGYAVPASDHRDCQTFQPRSKTKSYDTLHLPLYPESASRISINVTQTPTETHLDGRWQVYHR